MAEVIKFYVPKSFRKPLSGTDQLQTGKVIEFCSEKKRTATVGPPGRAFWLASRSNRV
jgi:hypothetical protein